MSRAPDLAWATDQLLRKDDTEPQCGKDFCDECGDCLSCYGGDPCEGNGEHRGVKYAEVELP